MGEADLATTMAWVLAGGVANPDQLRTDTDAVKFVRAFFEAGKPVGPIWSTRRSTSTRGW